MRDGVGYPKANFVATLDRVLPAVFVFEANAEDSDRRLIAHRGAKFLRTLAAHPGRHEARATLAIGEQDGRKFTDGFHVQLCECAAAGIGDKAGFGIDLLNPGVPKLPQFEKALLCQTMYSRRALSCGSRVRGRSRPENW